MYVFCSKISILVSQISRKCPKLIGWLVYSTSFPYLSLTLIVIWLSAGICIEATSAFMLYTVARKTNILFNLSHIIKRYLVINISSVNQFVSFFKRWHDLNMRCYIFLHSCPLAAAPNCSQMRIFGDSESVDKVNLFAAQQRSTLCKILKIQEKQFLRGSFWILLIYFGVNYQWPLKTVKNLKMSKKIQNFWFFAGSFILNPKIWLIFVIWNEM